VGSKVVGTARGGFTLLSVRDRLLEAGSASVKSVVLLDKTALRKVRVRLGAAEQQIV
jgi:hypoxanthine-guanine phosphoribosyltransferase